MDYLLPALAYLSAVLGCLGRTRNEEQSGLRAITKLGWIALLLGLGTFMAQVHRAQEDRANADFRKWSAWWEFEAQAEALVDIWNTMEGYVEGRELDSNSLLELASTLEAWHHSVQGTVDRHRAFLSPPVLSACEDFLDEQRTASSMEREGLDMDRERFVAWRVGYALHAYSDICRAFCPEDDPNESTSNVTCGLALEAAQLADEIENETSRRDLARTQRASETE